MYFRIVTHDSQRVVTVDVGEETVLLRCPMLKDVGSNWSFDMYEYSYIYKWAHKGSVLVVNIK